MGKKITKAIKDPVNAGKILHGILFQSGSPVYYLRKSWNYLSHWGEWLNQVQPHRQLMALQKNNRLL